VIICADSLDHLATLEADSVDLVCTDPPYAINFMGANWDRALPPVEIWEQCLRVLKPGAFLFCLCTPRQDCLARMICRLEDAGFLIGFSSVYWTYASGFPKAANLSKAADKRAGAEREIVGQNPQWCEGRKPTVIAHTAGNDRPFLHDERAKDFKRYVTLPATPEAKALDGAYGGFQPKPAVEIVLVAMKPPVHKTWLDQALDNWKGCSWLDDGRIPTTGEDMGDPKRYAKASGGCFMASDLSNCLVGHPQGRFPANLIVEDGAVDDGRERVSTGGDGPTGGLHDTGTFTCYFSLDAWWAERLKAFGPEVRRTFPFLICAKACRAEKNRGLQQRRNIHTTVKPIKLIAWLIALGSRPGDLVVDPFVGSGTTAIAARIMGREAIGIEQNPEYAEIAEQRLRGWGYGCGDCPERDLDQQAADAMDGQLGLFKRREG
jgi:site-specific DNA-methyltransferase (adenine-specific)